MPIIRIEEPSDPRLAPYFNLRSGQNTPASFIIESTRLVHRLLDSHFQTLSLLVTEARLDSLRPCLKPEIPVYVVSKAALRETVGFDLHRGCLAHAKAPEVTLVEELGSSPPRLVVMLEGLADPANVGAIIRNAAAFGADLVIADPKGASPYTRKATRASAGQIFNLPVAICEPALAIDVLRKQLQGVKIIATTGRRGTQGLDKVALGECNVLVFGNEGTGVSDNLRNVADACGRIAIADHVDSLNAAAASAVALHIIGSRTSQ